jgi:hypothetical protein
MTRNIDLFVLLNKFQVDLRVDGQAAVELGMHLDLPTIRFDNVQSIFQSHQNSLIARDVKSSPPKISKLVLP